MRSLALGLVAAIWCCVSSADDDRTEAAWAALEQGRAVLLLRHATAPGVGDPPSFTLGDCKTQRNLNDKGREEARRWGALLRKHGIDRPRLLSSRWCRSLETASEMNVGSVEPFPALDSFFAESDRGQQQTAEVRHYLESLPATAPVIMVSHQVNITALTGIFPRSGEGLILSLPLTEPVEILARIAPPSP